MENGRWPIAALAAFCLLLATASTAQSGPPGTTETVPLQYRFGDDLKETFGTMGASTVQFAPKPAEALSNEPVYLSKKPQYCELKLGDTGYTLVFDESRGTGTGYDTVYVDADANGNLDENVKLAASLKESADSAYFALAELQVAYGEDTHPYHIQLFRCAPSPDHIHVYSAACCEGAITVGGKTCKAVVLDGNGNGRFSDLYAPLDGREHRGNVYARGDSLLIDLDGDGVLKQVSSNLSEVFPLGKYLSIGGDCTELTVAPHGRAVTFGPCEAACGFLVPPKGSTFATLLGSDGAVTVQGDAGKAKVPAGTYHMASCSIEAVDAGGKTWRVTGRGQWEQPEVTLVAGEETQLAFGAPFAAQVTVDKSSSSEYSFNLKITGQAGEVYSASDFWPVDAEGSPPAPTLKILNEKGETVASGSFRYG